MRQGDLINIDAPPSSEKVKGRGQVIEPAVSESEHKTRAVAAGQWRTWTTSAMLRVSQGPLHGGRFLCTCSVLRCDCILYYYNYYILTPQPRLGRATSSIIRMTADGPRLPKLLSKSPTMCRSGIEHEAISWVLVHAPYSYLRFSINSLAFWIGCGTDTISKAGIR